MIDDDGLYIVRGATAGIDVASGLLGSTEAYAIGDGDVGPRRGVWAGITGPTTWSLDLSKQVLDGLTATAVAHGHAGLYPVAVEQIRRLDLARQAGRLPQAALAVADSRWSEFISWIRDNDGSDEASQWLSRSYVRALEAKDPHLRAYVLMRQSQRALDDGHASAAARLARQAVQGDPLPPKIHALCLTRLAEALALSGDDDSLELGAAADRRAEPLSGDPADAIAQHCDHRYVTAARARCRYLLGDYRSSAKMLEELLAEGAQGRPLDAGMWLMYLADSYRPQDPARAAGAAAEAVAVAHRCGSARIVRALLPLAVTLRPHRNLEPVARFLAAHREALTGKLTGLGV